jgi:hypothetical protein
MNKAPNPSPQGRIAGKREEVLISPLFSQATHTIYLPRIFEHIGKTKRGSHGCFGNVGEKAREKQRRKCQKQTA